MSINAKSVSWKENGEEVALSDIIDCEKLREIANTYSGLRQLGLSDKQAVLFLMACKSHGAFKSAPMEERPLPEKGKISEKAQRKEKRALAKKQSTLKMTC